MDSKLDRDLEKNPAEVGVGSETYEKRPPYVYEDGAVPGEAFDYGDSFFAKAQRLAGRLKIEQRGIERVPEDERTDHSLLNVGSLWLAANMVISSFALGVLGKSVFFLGFVDAILVILFFNLLGIMTVCFFSTLGPVFGLRQMILSRFWFGFYGVYLIAIFNLLACIGWSSVNVIVGAQLLHTVNPDVPGFAGIIIIAVCTFVVTLFGYKVVHIYEFWSWIPTFIIFLIVLGEFAHSGDFINLPMSVGDSAVGSILSFGSVIYGFATGWTSYAADYTVYHPSNQSRKKVFLWTWLGLIFPLLFTEMLGCAIMTATTLDENATNKYATGYAESGAGGLLGAVLIPPLGGFGKFCLVILALSIIANNCPNIYSVALTAQVFGRWVQRVPRFMWTLIATAVYIAVAIPGYVHFEEVLEHFMNFIAYWLAIYEGVALMEHFVFRRGIGGYDAEHYDMPHKLPPGIAAIGSFCVGVVGVVLGMSQFWFVGPIGIRIGAPPFGGDIGFELGFAFAAVAYLALRPLERKYFGR
ncbi:MAG: hypothetical protein M1831_005711 [Alyxoria varia]|nr:MAG: hypothetical protein M1831_005711 [Alyxoria varia]